MLSSEAEMSAGRSGIVRRCGGNPVAMSDSTIRALLEDIYRTGEPD
jgi:hypothetical protein